MDDLISRQAALTALALTAGVGNRALDKIRALPSAQPEIVRCKDCKLFGNSEQLPSAQPEIIHCKDCKFYGRADKRRFYRGSDCLNKRIDTIVPDRDFCSRAERKGEA